MANPSYVDGTENRWSNSTSVSIPLPGSAVAGNYCLIAFATRRTSPTVTPPSGWSTLKDKTTDGAGTVAAGIYGKTLDSGDITAGTADFTLSVEDAGSYNCTAWADVDSVSTPTSQSNSSDSTTATAPAIDDGQVGGDRAVWFFVSEEGSGTIMSSPNAGTLHIEYGQDGSIRPGVATVSQALTTTAAVPANTVTIDESTTSIGFSMLLRTGETPDPGTVTLGAVAVPAVAPNPIVQVGTSGDGAGGEGGTPDVLDPNASGFTDFVGYRSSEVGDLSALPKEGTITTTSNGQVISGRHCSRIIVNHANVTIRDCLIVSTSRNLIENGVGRNANLRIEWVTGIGSEPSSNFCAYNGYHAYRCDVSGSNDGFKANDNCTIEECWVHDMGRWRISSGGFTHNDCVQITGAGNGSNINLLRNRFDHDWRTTSCIHCSNQSGTPSDILIDGNRFRPGDPPDDDTNYAIYVDDKGTRQAPQNVTISNNVFVTGWRVAKFSISGSSDVTRINNTDSDGTLIGGQQTTPSDPQPVDVILPVIHVPVAVEGLTLTVGEPVGGVGTTITHPAVGAVVTVPTDMTVTRDAVVENPIPDGDADDGEQVVTLNVIIRRLAGLAGLTERRFRGGLGSTENGADAPVSRTPLGGRFRGGNT